MNVSGISMDLTNWTVSDGPSEGTITLQDTLPAGASIWIAREAQAFAEEYGFLPDYEYGDDTDPAVPNLATSGSFRLADNGDQVILEDDSPAIVDSVVYEGADPSGTGWIGDPEDFAKKGQVLYRKLDQATGLPVPDTDTVADWAQAADDNINGKKVLYPGWDLERHFWSCCIAAVVHPTTASPGIRLVSLRLV